MKIQLRLTNEDQSYPLKNPLYINALEEYGIKFVQDKEDFLLIHQSLIDNNLLDSGRPIIIIERTDSTNIIRKRELSLPNVLGNIKNTILRPELLNNEPYYFGRYHNRLVWELMPEQNEKQYNIPLTETNPKLTEKELSKVKCGYSFCHYHRMDVISNMTIDYKKNRNIDLHFAGTVSYGSNVVTTYHRNLCVKKAKQLSGINSIIIPGRSIPAQQYFNDLYQTKIVLSPWGHGEACYRDFEAIFCGCILLKPDSGFVKSWPDIYNNNKTYIPCKIDFSDLEEKVDWIRSNWSRLSDFRERNMLMVREARKPENFAKHMSEVFKSLKGE